MTPKPKGKPNDGPNILLEPIKKSIFEKTLLLNENEKLMNDQKRLLAENEKLQSENKKLQSENTNLKCEIQKININPSNKKNDKKPKDQVLLNFLRGFLTMLIFGIVKPYYYCCVLNFPGLSNVLDEEYICLITEILLIFKSILQLIENDDKFIEEFDSYFEEFKDPNVLVSHYISTYITYKKTQLKIENSLEEKLLEIFTPLLAFMIKYKISNVEKISLKLNEMKATKSLLNPQKINLKVIIEQRKIKNIHIADSISKDVYTPNIIPDNINEKKILKINENSQKKKISDERSIIDNKISYIGTNLDIINSQSMKFSNINSKLIVVKNQHSTSANPQNINSYRMEENNINFNSIDTSNTYLNKITAIDKKSNTYEETKNSTVIADAYKPNIYENVSTVLGSIDKINNSSHLKKKFTEGIAAAEESIKKKIFDSSKDGSSSDKKNLISPEQAACEIFAESMKILNKKL